MVVARPTGQSIDAVAAFQRLLWPILRLKATGLLCNNRLPLKRTIMRREPRMIVALLRELLRLCRTAVDNCEPPVRVDRIEWNHYWWATGCENHQVILWRWSAEDARFTAERFFFISGDGSDAPVQVGQRTWRFVYRNNRSGNQRVLVFETDDLVETVTAHDPWNRARAA